MKFKKGDPVRMTAECRERFKRGSATGVVASKPGRSKSGSVGIRRDGLKSITYWLPSQWEHDETRPTVALAEDAERMVDAMLESLRKITRRTVIDPKDRLLVIRAYRDAKLVIQGG